MSKGTKVATGCTFKPVLTFSYLAWEKIWKITHGSQEGKQVFECTSFGIMAKDDACRVVDIFVPKQNNSGAATIADDDDFSNWVLELHKKGIDSKQLAMWHHSHADMETFFSHTDNDTIERFCGDGILWSVVTNVKGSIKIRADMYKPFRFYWINCQYEVEYPEIEGLDEWFDQTVKPKMTFSTPKVRTLGSKLGHTKKGKTAEITSIQQFLDGGAPTVTPHETDPSTDEVDYNPFGTVGLTPYETFLLTENDEVLHLSHELLQAAYDEGLLTEVEALHIEHSLLIGSLNEDGLIKTLTVFSPQNVAGGKMKDLIRAYQAPNQKNSTKESKEPTPDGLATGGTATSEAACP